MAKGKIFIADFYKKYRFYILLFKYFYFSGIGKRFRKCPSNDDAILFFISNKNDLPLKTESNDLRNLSSNINIKQTTTNLTMRRSASVRLRACNMTVMYALFQTSLASFLVSTITCTTTCCTRPVAVKSSNFETAQFCCSGCVATTLFKLLRYSTRKQPPVCRPMFVLIIYVFLQLS